jgi:OMF family outer membrane factor
MRRIKYILIFISLFGKAQLSFNSLDSLLSYSNRNSVAVKITTQQSLLAKWTKVAAMANSINFRSPLSFSATDNILLPVNFIPADAFGGPAGTFRQITLGQEYVSNFNFNPQIDIINPANLARIKSASVNKELTEINNQLTKKTLYESIAAAYFNCLGIQEQITVTEKNLVLADSLTLIVKNKYQLGIAREQDLNNVTVNNLMVKDRLQQLKINLEQQMNSLKILCDIPTATTIRLVNEEETKNEDLKTVSTLQFRYSTLQGDYAKSELQANRWSMLPVLSFVYYQGWQKNSNTSFTDGNAPWIQSKYIGLRLTVPFPPDVNKLSQTYTSKVNYKIAALNASHSKLQSELNNQSMQLDLEKSRNSFEIARQIADLKNSNYQKSVNQYKEGILASDLLLTSFTDLLNSSANLAIARATMQYNRSKILISNSFK